MSVAHGPQGGQSAGRLGMTIHPAQAYHPIPGPHRCRITAVDPLVIALTNSLRVSRRSPVSSHPPRVFCRGPLEAPRRSQQVIYPPPRCPDSTRVAQHGEARSFRDECLDMHRHVAVRHRHPLNNRRVVQEQQQHRHGWGRRPKGRWRSSQRHLWCRLHLHRFLRFLRATSTSPHARKPSRRNKSFLNKKCDL